MSVTKVQRNLKTELVCVGWSSGTGVRPGKSGGAARGVGGGWGVDGSAVAAQGCGSWWVLVVSL